jgi:hypothetical protein
MMNTVWAVVREGRIVPLEQIEIPEGSRVLLTLLPEDDSAFWTATSQRSLDVVWNNQEDDVYGELLEK